MKVQDEKTDLAKELLYPENKIIELLLSMDIDVVPTMKVIKAFIS